MLSSCLVPSDTWLLFRVLRDRIHRRGYFALQELMLDTIGVDWRVFAHIHFYFVNWPGVKFVDLSVLSEEVSWFGVLGHKSCLGLIKVRVEVRVHLRREIGHRELLGGVLFAGIDHVHHRYFVFRVVYFEGCPDACFSG